MKDIRLLTAEDIDVRVAQTMDKGNSVKVSLLLYKDARVDMRILDELFSPMGWRRSHKMIGDRLYCQVDVYDETKGEWISKEDVGVESNTEAEKGQASDAFKRACFNWGIGRELYTAPKIVVELNDKEYSRDGNKTRVWATFKVKSIGYDDSRNIISLEIADRFGNVRYTLGKATKEAVSQAYTPLDEESYWNVVKAFVYGKRTKSGGDYRSAWIAKTHPTKEAIDRFDEDADNFREATRQ